MPRPGQMRPAYAGARLSGATTTRGLSGLGTRRQRYLFALICLASLSFPYSALLAAISTGLGGASGPVPIGALALPKALFPELAVPKFDTTGSTGTGPQAPGPRATPVATGARARATQRSLSGSSVRVQTNSYSFLPAPAVASTPKNLPGSAAARALQRALASAPVVTNVEAPPPVLPASSPARPPWPGSTRGVQGAALLRS